VTAVEGEVLYVGLIAALVLPVILYYGGFV